MKKIISIFVLILTVSFSAQAQDKRMKESSNKVIALEQTKGEFTQKQIVVSEGTYTFSIANNNVGTDVGFVLVPKGKDISNPENHIKTAYVTAVVPNNTTGTSNVTKLTKGEYVYFCPLNKTSTDNVLVVQ
ncbi:Cupredoxin-like domain-containing protein [Dokdonia sp. Hel_I_63]|jgi:plastocyanin|uniref:cupredoxin domain-containing protein n=1 Tax=Dokdonia sp. Hel_I_63 TaxID=1249996 RepID=UPI0011992744|nr:cupredoxin domain-containing protein [Dokdonia sp. Hel_I_63]TVZ22741.1 Cupredoxin-like domain-containing protein [Dokdonia sp. Hel_I_63]